MKMDVINVNILSVYIKEIVLLHIVINMVKMEDVSLVKMDMHWMMMLFVRLKISIVRNTINIELLVSDVSKVIELINQVDVNMLTNIAHTLTKLESVSIVTDSTSSISLENVNLEIHNASHILMVYAHNVDHTSSQEKESVWQIWLVVKSKDHMITVRHVNKDIKKEVEIV